MDEDGGFDCEFVQNPSSDIQSECPVCLQIIREPYQITCCGYAFCQVCIERVKQDNKPCPCCNSKDFDKFEDKRLKRSLYELKVHCTNKQQGCQWVGALRELDNHLNTNPEQQKQLEGCKFTQVKCLHCLKPFQRSDIQVHQSRLCPMRPFSCEYCKKFDSNYDDITTNHWAECGYYPLYCRCEKIIERQHLKAHISDECPLTDINCEFSHVGCAVKLPRKDMAAHLMENVVKHVSLQGANYKVVINRLEEENKQLKQQIAQLTKHLKLQQKILFTPICPVEFIMTNFEQHEIDDDEWISPPFYTHPTGYKTCIVVTANSREDFDGTHTSIGFYLMKGEFDDQLEWPFQGNITIRLISQLDEDYMENVINAKPNDTAASRVVTEENIANSGWVKLDFISHKNLQPRYLKNDCLKLCAYQYTRR